MYLFKCLWYQVKTVITWIYTVNYNTWYMYFHIETKTDKYDILNIPDGFSYVAKIEKYISINLEVLLLFIEIILKIILNFCIPILIMCHGWKFHKYLIMTFYWDVYTVELPKTGLS